MADINYFLTPKSWKVTAGSGPLSQILPPKGSSVRIEEQPNGSVPTFRIVPAGRSKSPRILEGFRYEKGRLELPTRIQDSDCLLVIEQDKAKGKKGLKGKVERPAKPKGGIKPLPGKDMTGTWGAETNPGSGSGGGGKQGDCQ